MEQTALLLLRIMMSLSCYQGMNCASKGYLLMLFFYIDAGGKAEYKCVMAHICAAHYCAMHAFLMIKYCHQEQSNGIIKK